VVNRRQVLAAVGVAVAAVGFVGLAVPELAVFGSRSTLALVAALTLIQGVRVARERTRTTPELVETDDPETEQDLAAPGDEFDETLAELAERPPEAVLAARGQASRRYQGQQSRERELVTDRIEAAAIDALMRRHGWSRERAREAVLTGEWTDDPYAAALFTGEVSGVGLRGRISRALSGERSFQRRVKHAAEAVAEVAESDRRAREAGPDPEEGGS
jgi:hypothetical protein